MPILKVDRCSGRSSCSLWITGTFDVPVHRDMEIGVSFMSMDTVLSWLLMAARTDTCVSILKCSTTRWWFNADRSMQTDAVMSVFFGTFGCRTREMFRSEPSLWLPWTAGHPRPFGDPGGCSWCGTWCCDGWVEVNVGSLDPPLPQLCWWPNRTWGAKPASQAPTCVMSTSACCWSLGCSRRLATVVPIGTSMASLDGLCMKGLRVLCDGPLNGGLTFGVFLVTLDVVASLVIFWKVTEDPDILSACLMLCSRCCSTFGSGPTTCDPSNGAVCTTLRTCRWNPKFFSRASLLSSCRLVTWSSHPWGLVHLFIVFKPLCYPGCRCHRVQ